jgi:hypothetical protein
MKLSVNAFAFACAIIEGGATLVLGTFAALFGYGEDLVNLVSKMYYGFDITFNGVIVGTFWGLVYGFIFGAVLAWVYNYMVRN